MEIVWLIMALTLSVCLVPAVVWVWWRTRRLEGFVRRRQYEQEEQLALLLHELVEELEQRGNALMNQIERKEQQLRVLLDQAALMQMYAKTHLQPEAAQHTNPEPEELDRAGDSERQKHASTSDVSVSKTITVAAEKVSAASDSIPTIRRQIQELLRQGLSPQEIAQRLQVGIGEVELARNLNVWREGQMDHQHETRPNEKK